MLFTIIKTVNSGLGILAIPHQGYVRRAKAVNIPLVVFVNPDLSSFSPIGDDVGYLFTFTGAYDHFVTRSGHNTLGVVYDDGFYADRVLADGTPAGNGYIFSLDSFATVEELNDSLALWISNPGLFSTVEANEVRKVFSDLRILAQIKGQPSSSAIQALLSSVEEHMESE